MTFRIAACKAKTTQKTILSKKVQVSSGSLAQAQSVISVTLKIS